MLVSWAILLACPRSNLSVSFTPAEVNVQWYIPFYSLYFILTGLHINFANTAYGLGRRYGRLNLMLRTSYLGGKTVKGIKGFPCKTA